MESESPKSDLPYRAVVLRKGALTRICRRCQQTDLKCLCHKDLDNLFDNQGNFNEPK